MKQKVVTQKRTFVYLRFLRKICNRAIIKLLEFDANHPLTKKITDISCVLFAVYFLLDCILNYFINYEPKFFFGAAACIFFILFVKDPNLKTFYRSAAGICKLLKFSSIF